MKNIILTFLSLVVAPFRSRLALQMEILALRSRARFNIPSPGESLSSRRLKEHTESWSVLEPVPTATATVTPTTRLVDLKLLWCQDLPHVVGKRLV